jgi:hypothetical protein
MSTIISKVAICRPQTTDHRAPFIRPAPPSLSKRPRLDAASDILANAADHRRPIAVTLAESDAAFVAHCLAFNQGYERALYGGGLGWFKLGELPEGDPDGAGFTPLEVALLTTIATARISSEAEASSNGTKRYTEEENDMPSVRRIKAGGCATAIQHIFRGARTIDDVPPALLTTFYERARRLRRDAVRNGPLVRKASAVAPAEPETPKTASPPASPAASS